jgi:hypothetical protein
MERPQAKHQTIQRDITGEIVYLDEMRRQNIAPKPFHTLGNTAIQMHTAQADTYTDGTRPAIMDEYEHYDYQPSEAVTSCKALADELLMFKKAGSPFTFVDIVVEPSAAAVLDKLRATTTGHILADEDKQLAIPSDGEYYPILDIRKQNAKLVDVRLRVWGWNNEKYIFTNNEDEQYTYPDHALVYPSDEKSSTRQLEISFGYNDQEAGSFSESVSLYLSADGSARISSNVWAAAYAETGYEGHDGSALNNVTDRDIAAFGDLVAEIVGDKPQSVSMQIDSQLHDLTEAAATPSARQAIQDLIEATWPAQAEYLLGRTMQGTDKTIAEQLSDEKSAEVGVTAIRAIIQEW